MFATLHKRLFSFESFAQGARIHLSIFCCYLLLFVFGYFLFYSNSNQTSIISGITYSRFFLLFALFHFFIILIIRKKQCANFLIHFWNEKGSAKNLALFRIFFFFTLAGHFAVYTFQKELSWTYMPQSSRISLPFIGWFIHHIPINPTLYSVLSILAAVFSFMVCIGFFTRYAILLLIPCALYVLGVPMFFGKINHHHILIWIPLFFCFAPIADAWSIDAIRKKKQVIHSAIYSRPLKFVWIQLAIIYFFAGWVKLWDCGFEWALGNNMLNQIRWEWVEHFDKVPNLRIDHYPAVAKFGGLIVIVFELLYFLLIFKKNTRLIALVSATVFHLITGYFMYIDFATLRMIALSYIDWEKFLNSVKAYLKLPNTLSTDFDTLEQNQINIPNKKAIFLSTTVLSINFIFSCFSIHSYPFSSYPTYSAIAPNEITTLRMDAYTNENKKVNVKLIAQQNKFRWETMRPYEITIAKLYKEKDTVLMKQKLMEYWLIWKNNLKQLHQVQYINLFLETTSIKPEERKNILKTDSLGVLYF